MEHWQTKKLGEMAVFKTGKLDSNAAEENGIYPFFTCSPETFSINTFAFDTEAVLLAGNNANAIFPVKYYKGKFNAYQRTYVIEPRERNLADCRYLYYLISFLLAKLKEASVGSATKFLTKQILENYVIEVPQIEEQKAIAKILGALDDKIELNRRLNQTLEATAQALFQAWFVDFEPARANLENRASASASPEIARLFPADFQESELGLIPESWNVNELNEFVNLSTQSINPLRNPDKTFAHFSIPAFDQKRQPAIESGAAIQSGKYIVAENSVLVSKLNPRIPRIWFPKTSKEHISVCSTEFMQFVPKYENERGFLYCLMNSETAQNAILATVTGTTGSHQRAQPQQVMKLKFVLPPQILLEKFAVTVEPMLYKIQQNLEETKQLAVIRDELLPKLISGQIRVSGADAIMRNAEELKDYAGHD